MIRKKVKARKSKRVAGMDEEGMDEMRMHEPQSVDCPRSGLPMRCTRTDGPNVTLLMSCGVMRMNCLLSDAFAVSI